MREPVVLGGRNQSNTTKKHPYMSITRIRQKAVSIIHGASKQEIVDIAKMMNIDDPDELKHVIKALQLQAKQFDGNTGFNLDTWINQRAKALKKHNLLMTDRQLVDFESGRGYKIGDKAKFIGAKREEMVGNNKIVRPNGQEGTIVEVSEHMKSQIIRFRPSDSLPDMVVREHTPGWLDLERIVE
jgi:hypothetical protein